MNTAQNQIVTALRAEQAVVTSSREATQHASFEMHDSIAAVSVAEGWTAESLGKDGVARSTLVNALAEVGGVPVAEVGKQILSRLCTTAHPSIRASLPDLRNAAEAIRIAPEFSGLELKHQNVMSKLCSQLKKDEVPTVGIAEVNARVDYVKAAAKTPTDPKSVTGLKDRLSSIINSKPAKAAFTPDSLAALTAAVAGLKEVVVAAAPTEVVATLDADPKSLEAMMLQMIEDSDRKFEAMAAMISKS